MGDILTIIIGVLIIYVGIVILFGGSVFNTDENIVMFGESDIRVTNFIEDEYNIIFGSGVIDLRDINLENLDKEIEIIQSLVQVKYFWIQVNLLESKLHQCLVK